MKKFAIASLLSLAAFGAFAGTATVEVQNLDGQNGTPDMQAAVLTVRENINATFAGDLTFTDTKVTTTQALANRIEAGLLGTKSLFGPVNGFVRVAVGERYTGTTNFTYYSVEPGLKAPIGDKGLSAMVSYRFRNAFDTGNNDTTRTWRTGLNYQVTPKDNVGVAYMRVTGDVTQNIVALNYTRGF
jgi:hypothetical protein